jgi:tetratricopeptide (TPR) repeat protein
MARFEKSRPQGPKGDVAVKAPKAGRVKPPPSFEDTMFFPRLRRRSRWIFVCLALIFSLGFVGFGVGAGGIGLGDLFRGSGSDGTKSISDARKETVQRPKDAEAWRALATALQADGSTEEAIAAQRTVVELVPKDDDALRELAGLQLALAASKRQDAQNAQVDAIVAAPSTTFGGVVNTDGTPLLTDPIETAVSSKAQVAIANANIAVQAASAAAVTTYKALAKLVPEDAPVQLELAQAANQAGDTPAEIAAYKRFLVLAPDDPSATLVRQQIKQLQQSGLGG